MLKIGSAVEPLNKGHIGTSHFKEVILFTIIFFGHCGVTLVNSFLGGSSSEVLLYCKVTLYLRALLDFL